LEIELKDLKDNQRPQVIQEISTARDQGDLSENAEYSAAKEKQSFIEGRIQEVEALVAKAEVIDPKQFSGDSVKFGATVSLENEDTEEKVMYKIVGSEESSIKLGKIAYDSPVARALIGKSVGDNVDVSTPKGVVSYEILKVEWI
ncbi:MAG: transcription elongation factor GreA, partial [Alphaproteobacteria bacterium]|nr:transcription elongation factor GreA [Alphaproteobacteria bacterium]